MNEAKPIALIGADFNSIDENTRIKYYESISERMNDYHVFFHQSDKEGNKPEIELFSVKELSPEAKERVEEIIKNIHHESRTV